MSDLRIVFRVQRVEIDFKIIHSEIIKQESQQILRSPLLYACMDTFLYQGQK
jgi:hypothetical protein